MGQLMISPEQRAWGNAFEKYLGSKTNPEVSVSEQHTESSSGSVEDKYGGGRFKPLKLDLPKELEEAFAKNEGHGMISANDWKLGTPTPSVEQKKVFLENRGEIETKLKLMVEVGPIHDYLSFAGSKVSKALASMDGRDCDLTSLRLPPGLESLDLPPILTSNKPIPHNKLAELKKALDQATEKTTQQKHEAQAVIGKFQPFLDSPENNPERERIGQILGELENLEVQKLQDGITLEFAKNKLGKLQELEAALFGWIDRRNQQGLPQAVESLALGDRLQQVHQNLIAELVDNKMDLPVSDDLSPEDKKLVKEVWDDLCDNSDQPKGSLRLDRIGRIPMKEGRERNAMLGALEVKKQVRSDLVRLMQSEAGRELVGKLHRSGKEIKFTGIKISGELEPSCEPMSPEDAKPTDISSLERAKETRGKGSGVNIYVVPKFKDSDWAATSKEGNILYSPSFVVLGHEMVHALHHTKGIGVSGMSPEGKGDDQDARWNNLEEFRTIKGGNLSEQTFRNQYGLTAERFGHSGTSPEKTIAHNFKQALDDIEQLQKWATEKPSVEEALKERGFDATVLPDRLKVDLYQDQTITREQLDNWDPVQLTYAQMKEISAKPGNFDAKKFYALGWKPFGLAVTGGTDSIEGILKSERFHERSPQGRRYRTLGGEIALITVGEFCVATGCPLHPPMKDNWPSQLAALEAAAEWFGENADDLVHGAKKLVQKCQCYLDALKSSGYAGGKDVKLQIKHLRIWAGEVNKGDNVLATLGWKPGAMTLSAKDRGLWMLEQVKSANSPAALLDLLFGTCKSLIQPVSITETILAVHDQLKELTGDLDRLSREGNVDEFAIKSRKHTDIGDLLKGAIKPVLLGELKQLLTTHLYTHLMGVRNGYAKRLNVLLGEKKMDLFANNAVIRGSELVSVNKRSDGLRKLAGLVNGIAEAWDKRRDKTEVRKLLQEAAKQCQDYVDVHSDHGKKKRDEQQIAAEELKHELDVLTKELVDA